MTEVLLPPFETPSLAHPIRLRAERALGLGTFRKIVHLPEGPIGACRATVAKAMLRRGGVPVAGWHIHVWPHLFFEAVAHYVWQSPCGTLVDLTAKYPSDRARYSVFIPGHDLAFRDGLHSRYYVIDQAPEVQVLIDASRRQGDNRRIIEASIRRRLEPDAGKPCRWLDHANADEQDMLDADERWVGTAIRACEAFCRRRLSGKRRLKITSP